jgi:hypothetical protein
VAFLACCGLFVAFSALVAMSAQCGMQCPACGAELIAESMTTLELKLPEVVAEVADSTAGAPTPESRAATVLEQMKGMAEPQARMDFFTAIEKKLDLIADEYTNFAAAIRTSTGEERPDICPAIPVENDTMPEPMTDPLSRVKLENDTMPEPMTDPLSRVKFFTYLEKRIGTADKPVDQDGGGSASSGSRNTNLMPFPPQLPPPGRQTAVGGPRPPSVPPSIEVLRRILVTSPKFGSGAAKQPPAKRQRDETYGVRSLV